MSKQIPTQFRIAARVLLLNKDNHLLLVANSQKKYWFTPGGRVEPDESLEQAAIRETYEETGIKIKDLKLVYIRESIDYLNKEKPTHHVCFYFVTKTEENLPETWTDHDGYIDLNRFFSKEEIQTEKLWPAFLKDKFWQDLDNNFKDTELYSEYKVMR